MTPFFSDSDVFFQTHNVTAVLKEHLDIFGNLLSCRGSDEKANITLKS